jgi:hypothetical protein
MKVILSGIHCLWKIPKEKEKKSERSFILEPYATTSWLKGGLQS